MLFKESFQKYFLDIWTIHLLNDNVDNLASWKAKFDFLTTDGIFMTVMDCGKIILNAFCMHNVKGTFADNDYK